MAAIDVRLVVAELQRNVTAMKTSVDAMKTGVDAINTVTTAWVVNGADGALPAALDVKAQLALYDALSAYIPKAANSLNDSLAVIQATV